MSICQRGGVAESYPIVTRVIETKKTEKKNNAELRMGIKPTTFQTPIGCITTAEKQFLKLINSGDLRSYIFVIFQQIRFNLGIFTKLNFEGFSLNSPCQKLKRP